MNWDHHIPLITDFWESILLDNPVYKKNAMEVHYRLNKIYPLEKKHFDAWLSLFYSSIDSGFSGPRAVLAKKRAKDIATLMQYKINNQQSLL
jgi:hemoglobin